MAKSKRLSRKLKRMFSPKVVMAIFIIFMLTSSAIGFIVMQSSKDSNSFEFNGYKFTYGKDGGVILDYNGEKVLFYTKPQDASQFKIDENIKSTLFSSKDISFVFNPSMGRPEIIPIIKQTLSFAGIRGGYSPEFGLSKESYLIDGYNVITCDDATSSSPVVVFTDGPENKITMKDNCITLESAEIQYTIRFYEMVAYTMLGVLPRLEAQIS